MGSGYAEKKAGCVGCPAYEWGIGFVSGCGPKDAKVVLIGQGPGEHEATYSTPFYPSAPSGAMLTKWLAFAGVGRGSVFITNAVQCWLPEGKHGKRGVPYGNREPTQAELEHCWRAHVAKEINDLSCDRIGTIGTSATRFILGGGPKAPVDKYLGTPNRVELPEGGYDGRGHSSPEAEDCDAGGEGLLPHAGDEGHCGAVPHDSGPVHADGGSPPAAHLSGEGAELGRDGDRDEPTSVSPVVGTVELWTVREETSGAGGGLSGLRPRGTPHTKLVVPMLHPSAVMRGRWDQEPAQRMFMSRLINDEYEEVDIRVPPPNTTLFPNLAQIRAFMKRVQSDGIVALDIESAGKYIVCIGFTTVVEPLHTLVVWFRKQGGDNYWDFKSQCKIVELLDEIFSSEDITLVMQNGVTFDVPELIEAGFTVRGPYLDTMHMAHIAYPEVPKGLQYLSTLHLGMPVWKTLTDEVELEGKA